MKSFINLVKTKIIKKITSVNTEVLDNYTLNNDFIDDNIVDLQSSINNNNDIWLEDTGYINLSENKYDIDHNSKDIDFLYEDYEYVIEDSECNINYCDDIYDIYDGTLTDNFRNKTFIFFDDQVEISYKHELIIRRVIDNLPYIDTDSSFKKQKIYKVLSSYSVRDAIRLEKILEKKQYNFNDLIRALDIRYIYYNDVKHYHGEKELSFFYFCILAKLSEYIDIYDFFNETLDLWSMRIHKSVRYIGYIKYIKKVLHQFNNHSLEDEIRCFPDLETIIKINYKGVYNEYFR